MLVLDLSRSGANQLLVHLVVSLPDHPPVHLELNGMTQLRCSPRLEVPVE